MSRHAGASASGGGVRGGQARQVAPRLAGATRFSGPGVSGAKADVVALGDP